MALPGPKMTGSNLEQIYFRNSCRKGTQKTLRQRKKCLFSLECSRCWQISPSPIQQAIWPCYLLTCHLWGVQWWTTKTPEKLFSGRFADLFLKRLRLSLSLTQSCNLTIAREFFSSTCQCNKIAHTSPVTAPLRHHVPCASVGRRPRLNVSAHRLISILDDQTLSCGSGSLRRIVILVVGDMQLSSENLDYFGTERGTVKLIRTGVDLSLSNSKRQ